MPDAVALRDVDWPHSPTGGAIRRHSFFPFPTGLFGDQRGQLQLLRRSCGTPISILLAHPIEGHPIPRPK